MRIEPNKTPAAKLYESPQKLTGEKEHHGESISICMYRNTGYQDYQHSFGYKLKIYKIYKIRIKDQNLREREETFAKKSQ